jgi:hypothetical protein
MKRLFALDAGNVENVAFMPPAQGNFNSLGQTDMHNADTPSGAPVASTGTADSVPVTDMTDHTDNSDTTTDESTPIGDVPTTPFASQSSKGGSSKHH